MTYYPDLTRYSYDESDQEMLNVGWLAPEHGYRTGVVDERVVDALKILSAAYDNQMRGVHHCEFCGIDRPVVLGGPRRGHRGVARIGGDSGAGSRRHALRGAEPGDPLHDGAPLLPARGVLPRGSTDGRHRNGWRTDPGRLIRVGSWPPTPTERPRSDGGPIQLVTCHGTCKAADELSDALGGVEVRNASGHQVDLDPRTGKVREWPEDSLGDRSEPARNSPAVARRGCPEPGSGHPRVR
ncbi:hypothetical protein GCM10023238_35370 [Streptomyces heliomycini]